MLNCDANDHCNVTIKLSIPCTHDFVDTFLAFWKRQEPKLDLSHITMDFFSVLMLSFPRISVVCLCSYHF